MKNTLYLVEPKYRYAVGVNASVRYRALHFIQRQKSQRQKNDPRSAICFLDEQIPHGNWDQAIFIRPIYSAELCNKLEALKNLKTQCIADYDDLLFAPELADTLPATINKISTLSTVRKDCDNYLKALKLFDDVIVSTERLSYWAGKLHQSARIEIKKNQLPVYGNRELNPTELSRDKRQEVHYFSGTRSHQKDFDSILPALTNWLKNDDRRRIVLRGSIQKSSDLAGLNVTVAPHCHYLAMGRGIQNAVACIAPLIDNEFNRCKSAIKFLEAAQHGVPVIASPVGEYKDIHSGGPILADSIDSWVEQLELLSANDTSWDTASDVQYRGASEYNAKAGI